MKLVAIVLLLVFVLAACGSGGKSPPPPPPCDQTCQDQVGLRAVREMMKLGFNLALQGKPVGDHDETVPCPLGGTARVFGNATSNAVQGATNVDVTYVFTACHYLQKDTTPEQNYDITLGGTITEKGLLAVQPTTNTTLSIASDGITYDGSVYLPAIDYHLAACPLLLGQDGGHIGGQMCGRDVGTQL